MTIHDGQHRTKGRRRESMNELCARLHERVLYFTFGDHISQTATCLSNALPTSLAVASEPTPYLHPGPCLVCRLLTYASTFTEITKMPKTIILFIGKDGQNRVPYIKVTLVIPTTHPIQAAFLPGAHDFGYIPRHRVPDLNAGTRLWLQQTTKTIAQTRV